MVCKERAVAGGDGQCLKMTDAPAILLTGATGYAGGRLLDELEQAGHTVRCLARRPDHLLTRVGPRTQVVQGDVLDADSLAAALRGIDVAFYLVHALSTRSGFEAEEHEGARNFASAAKAAGVGRIVYLGGLGDDPDSSPHLASRHEVGRILRQSGVPTIEFRASVIIGSGSLSFELVRGLARKLPVMVVPRWGRTLTQPIAVEDVTAYLRAAIAIELGESRVYDIGGPDQVSYIDLLREYARQRGLRRLLVPVPVLTPYLSSLWLGLVTPVYARVGRKLIDSTRTPMLVRDASALTDFTIKPRGVRAAIKRALSNEDRTFAKTRWNESLSASGAAVGFGGEKVGSRLIDRRTTRVDVPPAAAFTPIRRIGGQRGWYCGDWLWRLRGMIDVMVGGVGLRRGRRNAEQLRVGETLDFWRVEAFEPDHLLRLRAEMKLPGRAWLQFEVKPEGDGSRITQTAMYDPVGLFGLAYWYAIWPLHVVMFGGMLRRIAMLARAAAKEEQAATGTL
jgi:uncharacterized protein YbjT (DUF2867 family)